MKFVIFAVLTFNLFAYGLPVCERTQQVQDAIVKRLQKIMEDPTMNCTLADQVLDRIHFLSLGNKDIKSLKVGDFSGLTSLKWFWLYKNDFSTLPLGLFSELSSLKTIDLYDNKLSELPPGLFAGLSSLETIKLYNNKLSDLPHGFFSDLSSRFSIWGNPLKKLHIWGNLLSQEEKDRIRQELPHTEIYF